MHQIMKTSSMKNKFGTDVDIYTSEIHIMDVIGRRGAASISEIAELYGVSKAAISKTIDKLEKKGLAVKTIDPSNLSRKIVQLTSKGKTAFDFHIRYHEEYHSEILDYLNGLSEAEFSAINNFIEKNKKVFTEHF